MQIPFLKGHFYLLKLFLKQKKKSKYVDNNNAYVLMYLIDGSFFFFYIAHPQLCSRIPLLQYDIYRASATFSRRITNKAAVSQHRARSRGIETLCKSSIFILKK